MTTLLLVVVALDVLAGGSGEDVFVVDASLGGTIEGGLGTDTLSLVGISSDPLCLALSLWWAVQVLTV